MAIRLYDLAGADDDHRFSPHCWRVRMALAHKGLDVETVPWRLTEKDAIAGSGQGAVPVIVDDERVVHDSWAIARYLEATYPHRPSLFGSPDARNVTLFVKHWTERVLQPAILKVILVDLFDRLHERDKAYFRESRERRLGRPLEQVAADREANLESLRAQLAPLRASVSEMTFLGGDRPAFADYIVFGAFQWARVSSPMSLVAPDDPILAWRERLLGLYQGLAAATPAATPVRD